MEKFKKLSWSLYALILICFAMPFVTVSCGGQKVMSVTGIQLITGTTTQISGQTQKLDPSPYVIGAFIFTVIGLFFVIKNNKNNFRNGSIVNALTIIMLFIYKTNTDNQAVNQGQGAITLDYNFGFWGTVFLSFVVAIIMIYYYQTYPVEKKDK